MIEFQQLTRSYGEFTVVQPLTHTVARRGVRFPGPERRGQHRHHPYGDGCNRAQRRPALINGITCHAQRAEVQRHIGYLPDNPIHYDFLRGREILRLIFMTLTLLLSLALWQKARDQLPYLLDPDASPSPRVSTADGLIAAMVFFVLQAITTL